MVTSQIRHVPAKDAKTRAIMRIFHGTALNGEYANLRKTMLTLVIANDPAAMVAVASELYDATRG